MRATNHFKNKYMDQITKKLIVHQYSGKIPDIQIPSGLITFMVPATELHWFKDNLALVIDKPEERMRIICQIPFSVLQEALAEVGYTLYAP